MSFIDLLFYVVVLLYAAGFVLLIPFSRRPWANFWWAGVIVPLALSAISLFIIVAYWRGEPHGSLSALLSLDRTLSLFENEGIRLAALTEIFAMGLVVAAWMARKADQARFPAPYVWVALIAAAIHTPTAFVLFVIFGAMAGRWKNIAEFEEPWPGDSEVREASISPGGSTIVS